MNLELVKNLITNKFSGITMYRMNFMGKRGYVKLDPFTTYSGLTGALSAATFKGNLEEKRLEKWRDKMINHLGSIQAQEAYLDSMADFGTLTHSAIVDIWNNREFDFDKSSEFAREFFMESDKKLGIPHNEDVVTSRVFEYCKSVAALMQFIHDEVEDIMAVETMAYSDELRIATPIDLVCKIKGKWVSLNIKTSSQVSNHQKIQVAVEKFLWNNTYEEKVEATGIIRPKDWTISKKPTYELVILKPDEEEAFMKSAYRRLRLALEDPDSSYDKFKRETQYFSGVMKLGESPRIVVKSIEQIFNEKNK